MNLYHGAVLLACQVSSSLGANVLEGKPSAPTLDDDFAAFVLKHGREYKQGSEEFQMRKDLFAKNKEQVMGLNNQPGRPWRSTVNKFSDRTHEELSKLRGWKGSNRPGRSGAPDDDPSAAAFLTAATTVTQLPLEHSWMNLTSIKEVQDQGGCGSCWAFASATVLRAHSEIWMGNPRKFSVQQIISCTPNTQECGGTGGCQGATAELAMDYVYKHGCRTETELPYTQKDDGCPHALDLVEEEPSKAAGLASASLGMLGWTKLPENKLSPLKLALVTKGPVAVSISAGYAWNQYDGGIMDDCVKDAIIDHAVVLIGYGQTKNHLPDLHADAGDLKFWHLLNSWGTDWGEQGYLRMLRKEDASEETEQCGWDNDPQIGSGCKGGPPQVHICGMCGLLYDTVIPHFQDKRSAGKVRQHSSFLAASR